MQGSFSSFKFIFKVTKVFCFFNHPAVDADRDKDTERLDPHGEIRVLSSINENYYRYENLVIE